MHVDKYLAEASRICQLLNPDEIDRMAEALSKITGRVYCIGLGGSLANCMHMAADFRKLCNLDAVAPDNLAELTAWANDHGWKKLFSGYLSNLSEKDAVFILSVGGGMMKGGKAVSTPIIETIRFAEIKGSSIFGIVGPHGGDTFDAGQYVIRIPAPKDRVTPHTEAFQAVIWHCLVSHPLLQKRATKW